VGGDPERAVVVCGQCADAVVGDRRDGAALESFDIETIESHQTIVRADPEMAVAGLRQCADDAVGQTVVDRPGVHAQIIEPVFGFGGGACHLRKQQRRSKCDSGEEAPNPTDRRFSRTRSQAMRCAGA